MVGAKVDKKDSMVVNKHKRTWWQKVRLIGASTAVLAIVFVAGIELGNGSISFTSSNSQNAQLPSKLDYSSVNQVYDSLKDNFDGSLNSSSLIDGLKEGLATATGDPYTEYFSAKEAKAFNDQLNNSFSGIGAELGKDSDGNLIVISPINGFPAYKAGLKAQDIITSVDGTSTQGMSLTQAVVKIRGKKGTTVTLKIIRDKTQSLTLTITRDDIKLPSVNTKTLDGNIGYIQISTFADDTAQLSQDAANKFAAAHVKGIILDLRGNPGGLLNAAVSLSSLWVPEGKTILQEKRGSTVVSTEVATGGDILNGIPTVVLIDDGSASASEITAGALKDNGLATLIGVKSYGKGSVQQIVNFGDGSELKVTIARWYRPNGQNIDKKGITPDQTVTLSDADIAAKNDTQLNAAEAFLNK